MKGFLKKSALVSAFAMAAGGFGYHHFGTTETINVTVTSTEDLSTADHAKIKVETDKGTFMNEPSWLHLKGETATERIAHKIHPGAHLKLRVYGFNPTVGQMTLDDFGIHRNIWKIEDGTSQQSMPDSAPQTEQPAAEPGAAQKPQTTALPVPPPEITEKDSAPGVCARNADLDGIRRSAPQLARDLDIMEKLPLTGKPVWDILKDPKHDIQSCLFPVPDGYIPVKNYYEGKQLNISRGAGSKNVIHEAFHAAQDMRKVKNGVHDLILRDYALGSFLQEATAVAYELAASKEAEVSGIGLAKNHFPVESASDRQDTMDVFDTVFDAEINQGKTLQQALSAAGKNVVRRLLSGEDKMWKTAYIEQTISNASRNHLFIANNREGNQYPATRAETYSRLGHVAPGINFTPEEYLGADAVVHIDGTLKNLGIEIAPAAPKTKGPFPGA